MTKTRRRRKSTMIAGACLCGRIRYTLASAPIDAGYCHCRLCRRSSGAPVQAWLTLPAAAFKYSQGTPRVFHSSARGRREFCVNCGTQLVFRGSAKARSVDVTLASLEDPAAIAPQFHIWRSSRIPWFDTDDNLPRYDKAEPE